MTAHMDALLAKRQAPVDRSMRRLRLQAAAVERARDAAQDARQAATGRRSNEHSKQEER